jgi:hypothetical protein
MEYEFVLEVRIRTAPPNIQVVLYRFICWRLGDEQSLSVREHFLQSLNIDWRFGDLLLLKQKR